MRNLKGIQFIDKTYEKKIFLMRNSNIFAAVLIDLIAQQVEHLPFKERVLGSSPSQVTKVPLLRDFLF